MLESNSQSVLNKRWTVEIGHSRNPLLLNKGSFMSDFDQISSRSRGEKLQNSPRVSFQQPYDKVRHFKRDDTGHNDDFSSTNKPLKDLMFNTIGEKCFILLDKGAEISTSENKKEKIVLSESGLLMLVDVNDSKEQGVKNIQFNSMIQIKSELDFDVKLEFECENVDRAVFNLKKRNL